MEAKRYRWHCDPRDGDPRRIDDSSIGRDPAPGRDHPVWLHVDAKDRVSESTSISFNPRICEGLEGVHKQVLWMKIVGNSTCRVCAWSCFNDFFCSVIFWSFEGSAAKDVGTCF